jgi:hypothetical protein
MKNLKFIQLQKDNSEHCTTFESLYWEYHEEAYNKHIVWSAKNACVLLQSQVTLCNKDFRNPQIVNWIATRGLDNDYC